MYPKLRPIEIIPFQQSGRDAFALRDPTGLAPNTIVVSPPVLFILQRLDGEHDAATIRKEFEAASGSRLPPAQLDQLLQGLDQGHFLEGPDFEAHRARTIEEFRDAPSRPPLHAGEAYPSDKLALKDWYYSLESDEGTPHVPSGALVGIAAPHIDCRFGGASCRLVHEQLVERRPDIDTLVVLGTGHCAGEDLYTLTRQHYATPRRVLKTDRELVDAIGKRLGSENVFAAEILHRGEHSVEFQALFADLAAGDREPPRLVPVLVGSFHEYMAQGIEPFSTPYVRSFVDALREEIDRLGRKAAFVASIDLSHIGPRYGDSKGLSAADARRIEIEDRELLRFAEDGDPEGFFRHNQIAHDARRVCGFSALYTLLRLLPNARGTLLRYDQTTFPETEDTVAHCAMVFEQDDA